MQSLVDEKPQTGYVFRSSKIIKQPEFNGITYGLNSFRYNAQKVWNSLPNNIKEAVSLDQFKKLIKSWEGPRAKLDMEK